MSTIAGPRAQTEFESREYKSQDLDKYDNNINTKQNTGILQQLEGSDMPACRSGDNTGSILAHATITSSDFMPDMGRVLTHQKLPGYLLFSALY